MHFISALVIGEIRRGVERIRRRDPASARHLDLWLTHLRRDFSDRILPVTEEVADLWGQFGAVQPSPVIDGLLAATALTHDLTLVTRNEADVRAFAVRVINPFR
jgi:predicted nucleic acid-binding protein